MFSCQATSLRLANSSMPPPSHGTPSNRSGLSRPTTWISDPFGKYIISSDSDGLRLSADAKERSFRSFQNIFFACEYVGAAAKYIPTFDIARLTTNRLNRSVLPDLRPAGTRGNRMPESTAATKSICAGWGLSSYHLSRCLLMATVIYYPGNFLISSAMTDAISSDPCGSFRSCQRSGSRFDR